ncbi:hypothetical protein E2C01_021720 [Portunus trituberculatus]|uniref:BESS domain-containing protein n=1 Tax=Portunus trituberculatus TaxID=210409 RepID=A0A5B7E3B1_PORTR|nr:hypothetical protein [Portunus trituberculatus]
MNSDMRNDAARRGVGITAGCASHLTLVLVAESPSGMSTLLGEMSVGTSGCVARRMECWRKDIELSSVVVQCNSLVSVLEGCLGPYGKAVLLEKAGCVIITKDGMELLSHLEVCDPLVSVVVQGALDHTRVLGDGCKATLFLLHRLLSSLDTHVPQSSGTMQGIRRQKLIQIVQQIRCQVLGVVQRDVIKYGAQVNFRYLHKGMKFNKVCCVWWSINLEEEEGLPRATIETSLREILVGGILIKRNLVERSLSHLSALGTELVFSSLHFPDWAVSLCAKYGMSLLDSVDRDEWNFLLERLGVLPIMEERDVHPDVQRSIDKIEPLNLGTCRFMQLSGLGRKVGMIMPKPMSAVPIKIKTVSSNQMRSSGFTPVVSSPSFANSQQTPNIPILKENLKQTSSHKPSTVSSLCPDPVPEAAEGSASEEGLLEDEEELFGRYIAAAIRKLTRKSQSRAKMLIQQVLYKMEEFDRDNEVNGKDPGVADSREK